MKLYLNHYYLYIYKNEVVLTKLIEKENRESLIFLDYYSINDPLQKWDSSYVNIANHLTRIGKNIPPMVSLLAFVQTTYPELLI